VWDLRKAKRADAGEAAADAEPAALPVLRTWRAHEKDINSVAVSPNDSLIASGSADRSVRLWDAATGG
jgi:U3 small nucleolar RNA-associated protein 13